MSEPGRDHPPRLVALSACVGEADIGPSAERERPLLAEMGVVEPPEFPTVRLDEKIEAGAVGELVFALARFGVGDGRRVESAHGIGPSMRGL